MNSRGAMISELKRIVQPRLRSVGFSGSFPHFQRAGESAIELLTFQFDRHGGGFVLEIALCSTDGIVTYRGEHIPPTKVRSCDVHPKLRKRIQPESGSGTDSWFRYDRDGVSNVAQQVLDRLADPTLWLGVEQSGKLSAPSRNGR